MADEITPTVTYFKQKKSMLVEWAGFNAATEFGWVDTWGDYQNFLPTRGACIVYRTAGAEATVDVDIGGTFDNTLAVTKTDIDNIVALNTVKIHPAAGATDDGGLVAWRYWKCDIIDEGTNNTLTVKLWLW